MGSPPTSLCMISLPHSPRRPAYFAVAVLAVTTLAALLSCEPASARCGDKRSARPPVPTSSGRPPLVIGDSVLYNAVPGLARLGFEANSMICRRMDQGLAILRSRARRGILPRLVVLELGANGRVTSPQIDEALALLHPQAKLVLLTPTDTERPRGADAIVMRVAAMRYPKRVRVLEWAALAAAHPEWMARDGVHLRGQAGVDGLVAMIARALSDGTQPLPAAPGGVEAP